MTYLGALYTGSFDAHANLNITYPLEGLKSLGFDWSNANPQSFTIRHISTRWRRSTTSPDLQKGTSAHAVARRGRHEQSMDAPTLPAPAAQADDAHPVRS